MVRTNDQAHSAAEEPRPPHNDRPRGGPYDERDPLAAQPGHPPDVARVVIVLDHPAQHFSPAFRALDADDSVEVMVVYGHTPSGEHYDPGFGRSVSWDVDLLGGYSWTTDEPTATIDSMDPDVVIVFGWATPVVRRVLRAALRRRRLAERVFLYGDTTWQDSSRPWLRFVRQPVLRSLFKRVGGAISTGTFNRDFYVQAGMTPSHVWPGVCPADIAHYRSDALDDRTETRYLYAGKFVKRKGVDVLLRAALALGDGQEWSLTLAGDGPLRDDLQAMSEGSPVSDRVTFRGFVNQSEMPALMGQHDFLVVPSTRDLRALVVLEGMAAGLIPIVSDGTAIWGPNDVIEHGVTGFVFPNRDHRGLAALMGQLLGGDHRHHRLRCVEMAERHRPEDLASQIVALAHASRTGSFPLPPLTPPG